MATHGTTSSTAAAGCPFAQFPFQTPEDNPLGLSETWDELREQGPIVKVALPKGRQAWLALSYEAVKATYLETSFTRGDADGIEPFPFLGNLVLTRDGEEQRLIRQLNRSEFSPRRVESLRPRVRELATNFIEQLAQDDGPTDLIEALGWPLPLTLISEVLGIPEEDHASLRQWSDGLLVSAERAEEGFQALIGMLEYMKGQLTARRKNPTDDLLTQMAQRATALGVPDDSAALYAVATVAGGWETTAAGVANGAIKLTSTTHDSGISNYRYLATHPESAPLAVEELLRTVPSSGPGAGQPRYAPRDVTIAGVHIKAGDLVIPAHDASNRDPNKFPNPHRFDIHRANAGDHLSFGQGVHYCVGAALARLELQEVFSALPQRLPNLELATPFADLEFDPLNTVRRPATLPVLPNGA